MSRDLRPLFSPDSVAVIGASASPEKAGYAMMQSLSGFAGSLYPINVRGGEILGHTAYASVSDLPEVPDLAVLVVPPGAVLGALEECASVGVPAAMICSGGFAESGDEGAELQRKVQELVRAHYIRLLGPNTSGFMNTADGVFANFLPAVTTLRAGNVSIVAQSGGVNLALSFLLDRAGIGVGLAVGLGNAIDVGFADVLYHLAADPGTTAVGMHVEGVSAGRELMAAVRAVAAVKPIVILKVGKNDIGDFAKSHTGALTGSYQLTRQALNQAGAVIVDDPTQLVDALTALRLVRLAPSSNPGVGIITGQAGPGLIIADQLASRSATVPTLQPGTVASLSELLPPLTYQLNPVDTGRPGSTFPQIVSDVSSDPAVNVLGVYALDEPGAFDPLEALTGSSVPVLFGSGGPASTLGRIAQSLAPAGIPFFDSPDSLARGIAAVADDAKARTRIKSTVQPSSVESKPLGFTPDEDQAKALLAELGVNLPQRVIASTHAEAAAALDAIGGPVVVKVLDVTITHKSDVGGVHVGVRTAADLNTALETIDRIPGDGARQYLIEQQAGACTELIVGAIRDATFGPVVLLGAGGVDVELGGEPILTVAPLDLSSAMYAVDRLPESLLNGHRGAPPIDRDELAQILVVVSDLISQHQDIYEIDLNPVRITSDGALVLDALIVTSTE